MIPYKRVYAPIDLDAVVYNMNSMRNRIPAGTKLAGVVKTDGYGHGAVPIAKTINKFVDFFCVATPEEALELRNYNIEKPILILGPIPGDDYSKVVRFDIRPTIFTLEQAQALSDAAGVEGKDAFLHIAVDTGMGRIGLEPSEQSINTIKHIASLPHIKTEGIFTHMAKADETDKSSAIAQVETFKAFLIMLEKEGINFPIKHISNSAGIMALLGTDLDMVRAGITIYGIYPSESVDRNLLSLKPVMGLKSSITYVKYIEKGASVSYGGIFQANKRMRIATVPVGYGDGYPRDLSGRGYVLIDGKKAPILGRICMDQFMVDVSDIPQAKTGFCVTLLGSDGADRIEAEDLSGLCHRFPYEIVCTISKRVPRVYIKSGREVAFNDFALEKNHSFLEM